MLIQGGGDAANAVTCAARLGLKPRLISKVADDIHGKTILAELEADGVDTSYLVVAREGRTPFSYVIVDQKMGTRTCIFTPGNDMVPDDLSLFNLTSALSDAKIAYFDARYAETARLVAREAAQMNIPILVDAEKKRPWFDEILVLANYAVCAAKFPQAWTEAPSIATALVSMLWRLQKMKFVIVTLGEKGCIMIERIIDTGSSTTEEMDVDSLLASLEQQKDSEIATPTCIPSAMVKLRAKDVGTVPGRLIVGTAERIPPAELIDTTGAGDSFIGAILYALCTRMPPEKMLPFAAKVAASCCRSLGARTGLPCRTDPCLAPYLGVQCQQEQPRHNIESRELNSVDEMSNVIIPPNRNDEGFRRKAFVPSSQQPPQCGVVEEWWDSRQ